MKFYAVVAMIACLIVPQAAMAYTGREIMEQSEKLTSPDSGESTLTMNIYKGNNSKPKEKVFSIIAKRTAGENKVLLSFHKPSRLQLLTHAHKGREDQQWLVMSSGRIKPIVAGDKGKSFVHSHFYYEDLSSRDIDDYEYKNLGDAQALGVDCYKVEGVHKAGGKHVYDKSISYVRKSDFFIMRVEFYQDGSLHKYLENYDIQKIDGVLTPMRVVMTMADGEGRTELKVQSVEYNKDIPDFKFNKEALR